ncbi:MAG TPA: phosphomannomutase/phosphoglucomutase, partial [Patescibacteria group bacterium]|nr:phosphomannomutase/phosphoglucomutase [Patescibacteria group bacterium]
MKPIDQSIFKAYDIRGVYPEQLDEELYYKIGQAYAKLFSPKTAGVGRDVRVSGPSLQEALVRGLTDHGVDVVDIGVITTDMMYFTVANYGYDGGLAVTASHNPREYNGLKMVRQKGAPVSGDSGIMDMRDIVAGGYQYAAPKPGTVSVRDVLDDYIQKVLSAINKDDIKPLKVVANINFGAMGRNLKRLADFLPIEITWLNERPDGTFPKGRPDPLVPENRQEASDLIVQTHPDLGVAWDSDADRCFFFDETGRFISGYFTTAVLAEEMLRRYPKSKIIVDSKLNWAIIDAVTSLGGAALTNKTGHSFFKERMIKEDAAFGGEVSSHFYFKDFFYLDNGLIPFVLMLDLLSRSGKKMSELYQPLFKKYFAIDETNVKAGDVAAVVRAIKE